MLADHVEELATLEAALAGLQDPRQTIRGLVDDPPGWLAEEISSMLDALGEVANGYGLWELAGKAFERAADLPGADRPALLARAALDAQLAGDEARYRTLLERAEALDAADAQVVLARLRPGMGPDERLGILKQAPHQEDDRREAALNVSRAIATMDLGDLDEAERLISDVRASIPNHVALRELEAALVVGRNRVAAAQGKRVDTRGLRDAAHESLSLRDDLIASFRFSESGRLLARAITALALAGEDDDTAPLLDAVLDEERENDVARTELLEAALTAGHPEAVQRLAAPDATGDEEQLLLAQAAALGHVPAEVRGAVETLDRLLDSETN